MSDFKKLKSKLDALSLIRNFYDETGSLINVVCNLFLLLLIYGIIDFLIVIPDNLRCAAGVFILALTAIYLLVFIRKIFSLKQSLTARVIDSQSPDKREIVLSAWELNSEKTEEDGEVKSFLVGKLTAEALARVSSFSQASIIPREMLRKKILKLLKIILLLFIIMILNCTAFFTVLGRIILPFVDIPPYSDTKITLKSTKFSVLYGDSIELSADIANRSDKNTVYLVTESNGAINKLPCFNENNKSFSARLEKVTEPVKFCFATGKARSRWYNLNILLQPSISVAKLTVKQPDYSMLGKKTFLAGSQPIKFLRGAKGDMQIMSNRVLSSGTLEITPADRETEDIKVIEGKLADRNTISFTWELKSKAKLKFIIRDDRGTASLPLVLEQDIEPDNAPTVSVQKPELFIMATDEAVIDIAMTAEDDIGLKKVDFLRSLKGYKDRSKFIGPEVSCERFDYKTELDLKKLGIKAGSAIEFYFEAFDFNPDAIKNGTSDIHRIQVIDKEEYRKIMREKIKLEEIFKKFEMIKKSLDDLEKSLNELKRLSERNDASKGDLKKAVEDVWEKNLNAGQVLAEFKKDFPLFDIELSTQKLLENLSDAATANNRILSEIAEETDPQTINKAALQMLANLNIFDQENDSMNEDVKELKTMVEVMKLLKAYSEIVEEQETLVKSLNRTRTPSENFFKDMYKAEKEIFDKLMTLNDAFERLAESLTDEEYRIKDGIKDFTATISELKIPDDLKSCISSLIDKKLFQSHNAAAIALDKMKSLLSDKSSNPLAEMCNNKSGFPMCRKSARKTASEMMDSIFSKGNNKGKRGKGSPAGGGSGDIEDGYSSEGYSPFNVPVYGAERKSLSDSKAEGSGKKKGGSGGEDCDNVCPVRPENTETVNNPSKKQTSSAGVSKEKIPEKYEKAVKKYFGENLK